MLWRSRGHRLWQGVQITSQIWRAFCKKLRINVSLMSSYHPQSSGQAKRLGKIRTWGMLFLKGGSVMGTQTSSHQREPSPEFEKFLDFIPGYRTTTLMLCIDAKYRQFHPALPSHLPIIPMFACVWPVSVCQICLLCGLILSLTNVLPAHCLWLLLLI